LGLGWRLGLGLGWGLGLGLGFPDKDTSATQQHAFRVATEYAMMMVRESGMSTHRAMLLDPANAGIQP
jgi:hypothetical protein